MKFAKAASSAFTVVMLARSLHAAPALPEIDSAMDGLIGSREIAGAVTVVVSPNSILHLGAQGFADIEKHEPMSVDNLFWVASMTKPLTAVAVMMLVEEGKISLDDPASKYVPELGRMKFADGHSPKPITIRHLLTHTAGLPENSIEETRAAKSLQQFIDQFATKPMSFEPGTQWSYSQTGINSLGRIIEVVSGKKYEDFIAERITGPLGMKDTTFYPTAEQQKRLATSYKLEGEGEHRKLTPTDIFVFTGLDLASHDRIPLANGGLFSTAADYARFMQMLLNEGALDGHRYLKPETVREMSRVQTGDLVTGFIPGNAWGLGFCVVKTPGDISAALSPGSFGHGGAYGTQMWIDPTKKLGYLLLVQRANFPNSDASPVRKAFQDAALDALE